MAKVTGRRLPDTFLGDLPPDIRAGDYWRCLGRNGEPMISDAPTNLTGGVWYVAAPLPSGSFGIGRLEKHTVREHEDGTISVRPGDGSSNSILLKGAAGQSFHGYIEHGVWRAV